MFPSVLPGDPDVLVQWKQRVHRLGVHADLGLDPALLETRGRGRADRQVGPLHHLLYLRAIFWMK